MEKFKDVSKRLLVKSISLGGDDINDAICSDQNKAYLSRILKQPNSKQSTSKKPTFKTSRPENKVSYKKPGEKIIPMSHENLPTSVTLDNKVSDDHFMNNVALLNNAHEVFLKTRQQGSEKLKELIEIQIGMVSAHPPKVADNNVAAKNVTANNVAAKKEIAKKVIWDYADLLEFAEGKIAKVFGEDYAIIDTYKRRVRLPKEEYLLVSRVTKLTGVRGEYKPSKMTTEYDIPTDSPMTIDGQIPWAVAVESGQCDLLLISYLGIDFQCKGERVYRLLDCTSSRILILG